MLIYIFFGHPVLEFSCQTSLSLRANSESIQWEFLPIVVTNVFFVNLGNYGADNIIRDGGLAPRYSFVHKNIGNT